MKDRFPVDDVQNEEERLARGIREVYDKKHGNYWWPDLFKKRAVCEETKKKIAAKNYLTFLKEITFVKNLIKTYPNDADLGRVIRKHFQQ